MKKPIDIYLIVHKDLGSPEDAVPTRMYYLSENYAIREFQHYDKDTYSLCKYSVITVLEDDQWVNVEDRK